MKMIVIPAVKVVKANNRFTIELPAGIRPTVQKYFEWIFIKKGGFTGMKLIPPRTRRSTGKGSQNHHLNGHCQFIAMELGQPFEDVKKYVKQMAIDQGYPIAEDLDGVPMVDLWGQSVPISEADASVEECGFAIEASHRFAVEYGLVLPEDPEHQ